MKNNLKTLVLFTGAALLVPVLLFAKTTTFNFDELGKKIDALIVFLQESEKKKTDTKTSPVLGGGGFSLAPCYLTTAATTSPSYLNTTDVASTTLNCISTFADSIDLNINFTGSSTVAALQWENQFSHNNVDWFCEDGKTVDSAVQVTHGATCVIHKWSPSTTATSTRNLTITPTASPRVRVRFMVTGANGALWIARIQREPNLR